MRSRLPAMLCLLATAILTSCGDGDGDKTDDIQHSISVSEKTINCDGNAAEFTVSIITNHEWAAKPSDSWITITPESSAEQKATLTIKVQKNGVISQVSFATSSDARCRRALATRPTQSS